jgi:hypothetical protein
MDFKYILKVFIIVFFILSLITIGINLNEESNPKKNLQVVTIEGLENQIIMDNSTSFCEAHRGVSGALDESCGKLTQNKCTSTSCCVWMSDNKCVAGGQYGPIFNTNSDGKTKKLDYYFQGECYGNRCSKSS